MRRKADYTRRLTSGRRGAELRLEAAAIESDDASATDDVTATAVAAFLNRSSSRNEPPADWSFASVIEATVPC